MSSQKSALVVSYPIYRIHWNLFENIGLNLRQLIEFIRKYKKLFNLLNFNLPEFILFYSNLLGYILIYVNLFGFFQIYWTLLEDITNSTDI